MNQRIVSRKDIQHLLESPFRKLGHILAKAVFSPKKAVYPFPVLPGSKILFLRHDVLGDMITTLPLFRLVKRNFPEAEIHVLCTKSNSSILTYCEAVDHIHVVNPNILSAPHLHLQEIRAIRSLDFDIIVNCYTARTSKNGILIRLLSGSNTISSTVFAGERYASYFSAQSTLASSMISMWDKMFMLGVETFGLTYSDEERNPWLPALERHEQSARQTIKELGLKEKNFIAVNLSVGQERNIWPIHSYKVYLGYLLENGFTPLLLECRRNNHLLSPFNQNSLPFLIIHLEEKFRKSVWHCPWQTAQCHPIQVSCIWLRVWDVRLFYLISKDPKWLLMNGVHFA